MRISIRATPIEFLDGTLVLKVHLPLLKSDPSVLYPNRPILHFYGFVTNAYRVVIDADQFVLNSYTPVLNPDRFVLNPYRLVVRSD